MEQLEPLFESEEEPTPEIEEQIGAIFASLPGAFDDEVDAAAFLEGANPFLQGAWHPCFVTDGETPTTDACPEDQQVQPDDFTGEGALYSSGFMEDEAVFPVHLAEDLAPGTYTFTCLLHFGDMTTEVTVVAPDETADTAEDVDAARQAQVDEFVARAERGLRHRERVRQRWLPAVSG